MAKKFPRNSTSSLFAYFMSNDMASLVQAHWVYFIKDANSTNNYFIATLLKDPNLALHSIDGYLGYSRANDTVTRVTTLTDPNIVSWTVSEQEDLTVYNGKPRPVSYPADPVTSAAATANAARNI